MKIVITGASRGIGLATAKRVDSKDNQLFLAASSEAAFKDQFHNAVTLGADLTVTENVDKLANQILERTNEVDVLINNVGVMIMKKFEQLSAKEIDTMLYLNLRSHILLTHALLPALRKGKNPQIVFMSSMAAKSGINGESVYSATKGGVTNLANVLRNELGPQIRVSTVHAWGVDTWGATNPKDFIQPSDVAEIMDFIISRPDTVLVESIDLGNPKQWRGGQAPWSP